MRKFLYRTFFQEKVAFCIAFSHLVQSIARFVR